MTWHSRLVAYEPGTETRIGYLPDALSYEASLPRNDAGALRLTYSRKAVGGSILDRPLRQGLDVALEVNWLGGVDDWVEPAGARFVWADVQDDAADETDTVSLVLPSYGWLLSKIGINALELLETTGPDAGRRLFVPGRAGLLRALLDEWASRHPGKLLRLAWNFSATHDSTGAVWARTLDAIPYDAHTPLSTVLASLASMDGGLCDWETVGRTLALYNPDSRVADLSGSVRLELRRDVSDAPSQETIADSAGWIMVRGEGNVVGVYADAGVPDQIAAWETTLQASGATTEADALAAAAGDIEWRARDRGQYTRQLLLTDRARWLPLRDYAPGDVVSAWARTDRRAMRVQQITLSRDGQGQHSGSVVLNDRLVPADLRQARTLRALAQNAAISGTGTVIPATDTRQPAAPGAPTLSDQRILDAVGVWRSRIGASWLAVTQATNGTALVPVRYELWGQPQASPTQPWRRLTTATGLSAAWEPFDTGSTWRFAVKAVGPNGKVSELGAYTQWIFGPDTTPPNKPATPTATPYLGALVVAWSGKDTAAADQPADFARCEVHVSTTSGFAPTAATLKGEILPGGTVTLSGLAYGVVHYVRLVSVDFSGNRSVASDQVAVTPRRAVTDDMANSAIDDIVNASVDAVMPSIAGKNRITHSSANPTNYAGQIEGDTWFKYSGATIVGWWRAASPTVWAEQTLAEAWLPQVNIGTGTYGLLDGARLLADSIAVSKLLVSDWQNLAVDAAFKSPLGVNWSAGTGVSIDPSTSTPNRLLLVSQASLHTASVNALRFDALPGEEYRVSFEVARSAIYPAANTVALVLTVYLDNGTTTRLAVSHVPTSGWETVSGTITMPAGARQAQAELIVYSNGVAGQQHIFRSPKVYRRNTGEVIVDGSLTSNKMSATDIFTINNYAGSPAAAHTRMTPDGFSAWAPNPDAANAIQKFSWFGDGLWFGFDPTLPLARITGAGDAGFKSVTTDALRVGGDTLDEILARLPRGTRSYTQSPTSVTGITTTQTPVLELRTSLEPDRLYEITVSDLSIRSSVAGDRCTLALRVAYDGAAVGIGSAELRNTVNTLPTAGVYTAVPQFTAVVSTAGQSGNREARLLLTAIRSAGTGTIDIFSSAAVPILVKVTDVGPAISPTTTAIRYVSEWRANTGWRHDGASSPASALAVPSWNGATLTEWGQRAFTATAITGETSRTLASAMSGATLVKAEIQIDIGSLYRRRLSDDAELPWPSPALRLHPTANTTSNAALPGTYLTTPTLAAPGKTWVDITSLWTTAHRGFYLSLATDPTTRGEVVVSGDLCRLRLTYLR